MTVKAAYVRGQGQIREHHCHWPGCAKQVPPAAWGCKPHWFALPKELRDRVWRAYRPGQEVDMRPSREYLQVADDVQRWILSSGQAAAVSAASPAGSTLASSASPDQASLF